MIFRYLLAPLAMISLASCGESNDRDLATKPGHEIKDDFFPQYIYGKQDAIYLDVMIDDCGEWGGPQEEFKIYVDSANTFKLDYKKFRFNCDSITEYYGSRNKRLDYRKSIVLSAHNKKAISTFFLDMMQAKIHERVGSNAGSIYSLRNVDSTLSVDIYTTEQEIENNFRSLKKNLRLEK